MAVEDLITNYTAIQLSDDHNEWQLSSRIQGCLFSRYIWTILGTTFTTNCHCVFKATHTTWNGALSVARIISLWIKGTKTVKLLVWKESHHLPLQWTQVSAAKSRGHQHSSQLDSTVLPRQSCKGQVLDHIHRQCSGQRSWWVVPDQQRCRGTQEVHHNPDEAPKVTEAFCQTTSSIFTKNQQCWQVETKFYKSHDERFVLGKIQASPTSSFSSLS